MNPSTEQITQAQRATVDMVQQMAAKMQEATTQLMQLNMKTMQEAMTAAPPQPMAGANGLPDMAKMMQPSVQRMANYFQQAAGIMSSAGMEIASLVQKNMTEQGTQMAKATAAASAQFGAQQFADTARRNMEAAQEAMGQMVAAPQQNSGKQQG